MEVQYQIILEYMEAGKWYKTSELVEVVDVGERQLRKLLKRLVEYEKLVETGITKGKKYKINDIAPKLRKAPMERSSRKNE